MASSPVSAPAPRAGEPRFREALLSIMDRKDHPSYWRLMSAGATRDQLLVHYRQEWEVYVRDFPVFLARVMARCPEAEVRRELAGNLYEEETGGISGGGPHGELFLDMMKGLGFPRDRFAGVRLLPASRAYRRFLDEATTRAPWVVGLAVATILVEGSRNERADLAATEAGGSVEEGPARAGGCVAPGSPDGAPARAPRHADPLARDPLVVHHGLDPRYLELKRVHRKVEGDHRASAWRSVLAHARTARARADVERALLAGLTLWTRYRDGVARAARLR